VIRQYGAQRRRGGDNPLGVGVVAAGTIVYLQDDGWWRDRYRGRPVCRNPWMVTAFLNGTVAAGRRKRDTGLWEDVYVSRRSDMAIVRSLRDGRQRKVAVRTLILQKTKGWCSSPRSTRLCPTCVSGASGNVPPTSRAFTQKYGLDPKWRRRQRATPRGDYDPAVHPPRQGSDTSRRDRQFARNQPATSGESMNVTFSAFRLSAAARS
jgi:hypothetical protein